jgi:hypothetical protein
MSRGRLFNMAGPLPQTNFVADEVNLDENSLRLIAHFACGHCGSHRFGFRRSGTG